MKVEIKIDEKYIEPNIIIYTNEVNENISKIVDKIKQEEISSINAVKDEKIFILKTKDIEKIYSLNGKVFLESEKDKYEVKKRMYELEELLPKDSFIRISNSEIINLDKVSNIDLKIYGTLKISFFSGHTSYASRRYIKKIKEFLNI